MQRALFCLLLVFAMAATAQSRPTGACRFRDFATGPQENPQIAVVKTAGPAATWSDCESPKGCAALHAESGSPVEIYSTEGEWTCGYSADRHGAGPEWFRSADLRLVQYDRNPPLTAWAGTWRGGEDRVVLTTAKGALHLEGDAIWNGRAGVSHFGDVKGEANPVGNHLHFVEGDEGSCTIDMTLMGRFILASDNQRCGALNARFRGFWKRAVVK
jgi:hypothetical protein